MSSQAQFWLFFLVVAILWYASVEKEKAESKRGLQFTCQMGIADRMCWNSEEFCVYVNNEGEPICQKK